MKPATFLKGIHRIIFDMDGVITSEQNYWNAAALTVYEMLYSSQYFGDRDIQVDPSAEEIKQIRKKVFLDDQLISLLKDRGINTNWDLAYVVLCIARILYTHHFEEIYRYISVRDLEGEEIYRFLMYKLSLLTGMDEEYYQRHGEFWNQCQKVFQEWYLGEKAYLKTYGQKPSQSGKKGLMYSEQPIIPLDELRNILKVLHSSGISLGIGTGRPFIEIHAPLVLWEVDQYFDRQSYITYTEVEEAEKTNPGKESLAKPHPYVFLKAIFGKESDDSWLLRGEYDKGEISHTLIVGDAGSDIMAAKAIQCKFAAVLTGVSGQKARSYFEQMGADYILDSIRELVE